MSKARWFADFETAARRKTVIIRDREHRGMRIAEVMNPGYRKRARLIAATSQMLAALEGCGCICYSEAIPREGGHAEHCDAVSAAIAAAKGESQ